MMEVIKMEVDVDPLAIQSSDNTNTDGKKPLLEEGHLLDLHMAGIKTESVDHTYDFTSGNKVEESAVASNFVTKKCKAEEKYDVDAVKDELKLEVTAEENEILINRIFQLRAR
ncbi:uncharacterized protein [Periplaneta americana]|uniref:uncharacterized protein isoform X3 n=1 Tax=Periplaneta americana TaxID=6978 RepID=UPI0037E806F0